MSRKILLVDDSRDLLDAYATMLRIQTSHTVRTAASGRVALDIIRAWRPDIVVTDIMMPDMNGLDLISRVRSDVPPPLPIIAVWSGFPEYEQEAMRRGAQVFQPKPLHPDNVILFIESLLGKREPPAYLRADALARRRAASQLAQDKLAKTLARRPYFQRTSELSAQMVSRYFEDSDLGILVMQDDRMRVFAASGNSESALRFEKILSHVADIVQSGSSLILPDLSAMPAGAWRTPSLDARTLVAVPVKIEGASIGALALADRMRREFDAHDLAILEHIGEVYAGILADELSSRAPREPGVLAKESWRYCLSHEIEHLDAGRSLVLVLARSSPSTHRMIPATTPSELKSVEATVDRLIALLPPRTAMGRLNEATLAAYTLAECPDAGEDALQEALMSLTDQPQDVCIAGLSMNTLHPTDGGAAIQEIGHSLLAAAISRGPGTALHARISPESAATGRRRVLERT